MEGMYTPRGKIWMETKEALMGNKGLGNSKSEAERAAVYGRIQARRGKPQRKPKGGSQSSSNQGDSKHHTQPREAGGQGGRR
jgi:hypothetical protein